MPIQFRDSDIALIFNMVQTGNIRDASGIGNNVANPTWGAAGQPFIRLTTPSYRDGVSALPITTFSPREVSDIVSNQDNNGDGIEESIPNPFGGSAFLTFFGQYFDHGLNFVGKGGASFGIGSSTFPMNVTRATPMPGTGNADGIPNSGDEVPTQHINTVSPYVDQNQTYGSHEAVTDLLRRWDQGANGPVQTAYLLMGDFDGSGRALLPTLDDVRQNYRIMTGGQELTSSDISNFDGTGHALLLDFIPAFVGNNPANGLDLDALGNYYIAGDGRVNENVVLTSIHTIWARNHNFWVDHLRARTGNTWTEEQYFQAAKIINIAEYQNVVFGEFADAMAGGIRPGDPAHGFTTYDPTIDASISAEFAHAAYRFGHSMLNETVSFKNADGSLGSMSLVQAFLNPNALSQTGIEELLLGATGVTHQAIDVDIVNALRNQLVGRPLDLAALNIFRGRDTGIAPFNTVRAELFAKTGLEILRPYTDWADFQSRNGLSNAFIAQLQQAYPEGFEQMDLWVGGLAEQPSRGQLGSTFGYIFIEQLDRLQKGDRFYYLDILDDSLFAAPENIETFTDIIARTTGITGLAANVFQVSPNGSTSGSKGTIINTIALTAAQAAAFAGGGTSFPAADNVAVVDTGTNLATLTAAQITALITKGVDAFDASDDTVALSVAQLNAVGGALADNDVVTLADTGATIAALSAADIAALAGQNVAAIDATDNALTLTLDQVNSLGTVALTAGDTVSISATGAALAALSAAQITALGGKNVDVLDASDGTLVLDAAQASALLGTGLTFVAEDTITVRDSTANLNTLSAEQRQALSTKGVDAFEPSDAPPTGNITVADYRAAVTANTPFPDASILVDMGANISGLTPDEVASLAAFNVTSIDASDNALALSLDQFTSLGAVTLTQADTITLRDTGAELASGSPAQIAALAPAGIDIVEASDGALTISLEQFGALGSVIFAPSSTVTISDTGANFGTLSAAQVAELAAKNVDVLDASDNNVTLTVAQAAALAGTVITFAADDGVGVLDTGAALATLTAAQITTLIAKGVDALDASDNAVALSLAQFNAVGGALADNDVVTLADTGANLAALSAADIAALAGQNVAAIDATDNALTLTLDQVNSLGTVALTAGDTVSVSATGAALAALSAAQITALGGKNVDVLDASDGTLVLDAAQASALLGTGLTFVAEDTITVRDSTANLNALSAEQRQALSTKGVDAFAPSDIPTDGDPNVLVDDGFYLARYPDVLAAGVDPDAHYATFGWHEGRDPNALFSTNGYLSANADVHAAAINPLEHYHQFGWKEGRDASITFDTTLYLQHNPDVAAAGIDPLEHYLAHGRFEGRQTYEAVGLGVKGAFDAEYYLLANPDVGAAGVDPLLHFQTFGWKEGRDPNGLFDTSAYLATYTDVAAAGMNPLDHYNSFGWKEGRDPSGEFDTSSYLAAYTDVAQAGVNPLQHYLQFGIYEGRNAFGDSVIG